MVRKLTYFSESLDIMISANIMATRSRTSRSGVFTSLLIIAIDTGEGPNVD